MPRPGYRLALFATALALLVVLLGAYTRLTHAGLGCPDWPGCYGFISVPSSAAQLAHVELHFPQQPLQADKGWAEMLHRYAAGVLALTVAVLALHALRRHLRDGSGYRLQLILLGVVLTQGAFGMWTVTLKLWPQVVTAHLLGGLLTLSLLALLSLRLSQAFPPLPKVALSVRRVAALALLLVIGQVALGGWVSANYAAVACIDLPTCHGQWWPQADFGNGFHLSQRIGPNYLGGQLDSEARTAIHLAHRLGALLVTIGVSLLAWQLRRCGLGGLARLLLAVLTLQLALGMGNVLLHLPLAVAVAHNAGAALLLLAVVLVNYRIRVADKVRHAPGMPLSPAGAVGLAQRRRAASLRRL